jgi:hypothetical protein
MHISLRLHVLQFSRSRTSTIAMASPPNHQYQDDRPEYIMDCFDNNGANLNIQRYLQYLQRLDDDDSNSDIEEMQQNNDVAVATKRPRQCKKITRSKILEDGTLKIKVPKRSVFYEDYIDAPDLECNNFNKEFRNRFRMPYEYFMLLVDVLPS